MGNKIKAFSPIYEIYSANSEIIDAAIEIAVKESALKMGDAFKEVFSIHSKMLEEKKSA